MIACISPANSSYDDIVNTLNYASRARKIQNKITKNFKENDNDGQYKELIQSLKLELSQLKEIIRKQNSLLIASDNKNDNLLQINSVFDMTESLRKENNNNINSNKIKIISQVKQIKSAQNVLKNLTQIPLNINSNVNMDKYEKHLTNKFTSTEISLEELEKLVEK